MLCRLREVLAPPLPVIGGTGQLFDMGKLAMQRAQQHREACFELWRIVDDLLGIQAQLGLVIGMPWVTQCSPLFKHGSRVDNARAVFEMTQQIVLMLRAQGCMQLERPLLMEGEAQGVVDEAVVDLYVEAVEHFPVGRRLEAGVKQRQQL